MAWLRTGECCKCGDCCRGNPFVPDGDPNEPCPLLGVVRKDGTRLCTGHGVDPYYLSGCNVWPTIPEHVAKYSRCSYRFEWVDDGG